jgi:hypothetical protein
VAKNGPVANRLAADITSQQRELERLLAQYRGAATN